MSMPKVKAQRIHFAFLDGPHTYDDLMFEFELVKQRQLKGDVIVCDDFNERKFPGIVQAVNEIIASGEYVKIQKLSADQERCYLILEKQK